LNETINENEPIVNYYSEKPIHAISFQNTNQNKLTVALGSNLQQQVNSI